MILRDLPDETSPWILFLYNKILENEKEMTVNDFEIILSKNANLNDSLYLLSKVKFNELKYLVGQNCNLIDTDLNLLKNLFSQNSLQLDLSNNELRDISIFAKEEESLVNLSKLDLSHNKIVDISNLFNCRFLCLKELNLSHNEISDINGLQQNLYFNSLKKLDLSFNRIKILNKINIKTLNYLDLKNNEISEGFIDFLNNFCNSCFSSYEIEKLELTRDSMILIFNFHDAHNSLVDLKFSIEEKNVNEVFKTIPLEPIKNLEIYGFNNLEWLSNESLENLEILNFKTEIDDLTIFNNVKFINLKKIIFCKNEHIIKGFNSFNIFSSIKLVSIGIKKIENNYECYLSCENPEIQNSFIFDNLNFLKEKFLRYNQNDLKTIDIAQEILDDKNNIDFFSFNEIINSFPIFKNLKAQILDINYINNKYYCKMQFYNSFFKMNSYLDDLNILKVNELFENLEILNFEGKIIDLSILNNLKFKNLTKIGFYNDKPILKEFNSFNIFSSIELISIKIEKVENKYECYLSCENPEIKHAFIFDNLNFLKEKFLGYNQNDLKTIDIAQEILDDKNNIDFFSFNEIINSFPIFKNLKARILNIDYINNKYFCKIQFYYYKFKMNFYFDDLNFLNNCIFKEIEELYLSNVIYNDIGKIKEKFPNFKKLILNEIELLDLFEERTLYMENIATEGDKIKINFI